MADRWVISVGGRIYGPYSAEEMHGFAKEGRLTRQSSVASAGASEFRAAADEPALAALFDTPELPRESSAPHRDGQPSFGRVDDKPSSSGRSHVVIFADLKSGSVAKLEEEIFKLGPAIALLSHVWLVCTEASVNAIRNRLVQQLGKIDQLFVIDASNDKAAWFNVGMEADARIRGLWRTEPKLKTGS